ncbi:Outer membrane TonB-dependent transporter, utilization system for glycans and polysaccharides (PUL), SusC family [hydrothermal vent metagenome]|uniref:Outer membrane TonB-dependent transporter, utilization system for glycans and polysaccharides (PUL), SusC family n=1 Tax=hydrothermal vent metagenome TaxID=652676 RepID=A0A3B0UM19_9ZZZZ
MKKLLILGLLRNQKKLMRVMKITFLLVFGAMLTLSASTYSQVTRITLDTKQATVKEVLEAIEGQSEFIFFYQDQILDLNREVNIKIKDMSIEEIMDLLLKGTSNNYMINDRQVIIGKKEVSISEEIAPVASPPLTVEELAQPQTKKVSGKVTDQGGDPLPGVNVVVKGETNIGTITDSEGNYSIEVPLDAEALEYSFIGMVPQTVVIGTSSVINVTLESSTESLDEVVVTALGIQRKVKALGFSAQELGAGELSANREANLSNFLTGKVAGVQVSKTSSGTGGSSVVTIRGNSSLSGNNQPLYVVDGIPIINEGHDKGSGSAGLWGDNDYGDGIGDINPEDVESMTVLKGPNASALYGSRGANGVILITTKSGRKRKGIGVEINSNISIETLNLFPEYQNKYGPGYEGTNMYGKWVEINGKLYETLASGASWGVPLDGRRTVVDPYVYPGEENTKTLVLLPQPIDNVRNFFETAILNTNTVALSGGTDKTTARLSFGNTWSKGIMPNHRVERKTITLRATSQLTDFLSFDAKVNYVRTDGRQRPNLGSSTENPVRTFASMGRWVPMDFLKEYYEKTGEPGRWPGIYYNPYYVVNELKNKDYRDRLIGLASTTVKFTDWLSLLGRVGIDSYSEVREKTWPVGSLRRAGKYGRVTNNMYINRDFNADAILTANKKLSNNLSGNLSLGASLLTQRREHLGWDARNFKAPGVYHVSNAQDIRPSAYLWQKEMQSVYFTGQLSYKDYLFFDVTGRNDWSSALGRNNYSFFYPSVSTSFVFTDALELNPDILSFGKVRVSWAQVGNDSDPYLTISGYNSYTTSYTGQSYASASGTIPLFDLKNELSESWEIGTDLRFFKNRLGLDVTYYNGKTTNQILPISISNASGYSNVVINAGEIQNKGLEIFLNATPIKTNSGFRWDLSFNYARNHSTVVELAPGIESYTIAKAAQGSTTIEARVGEPYGDIIGYKYKRAPDGQRIVSGDGGYVRESKQSVLGNITPDWIGGLNNSFSYKGFSFNFLLDFVQGGEIYSSTKYEMMRNGTAKFTEEGRRPHDMDEQGNQLPYVGVLDGVVEITDADGNVTGYEKNTKAVSGMIYWATRGWSRITEECVLDGSYIMLREVMMSYNLNPSLLKKTPIKGLTLTLVGRNLWYIEEHMQGLGISPESAPNTDAAFSGIEVLSMPTTRTFGLNVKLTF